MDDDYLIGDLTLDEVLALCCDKYCRFCVQLPKNRLEDKCDNCALIRFVVRAFEERE